MGEALAQGLANGMSDDKKAVASATDLGNSVITGFKDVFEITSPSKVMYKIGQFVGQGFADGLRGSTTDIKDAFTNMNAKLSDAMVSTRETIAKEQGQLKELLAKQKQELADLKKGEKVDPKLLQAIRDTQKTIADNEALLARLTAGHRELNKALRDEKAELIGLANDYVKIGNKLKEAENVLAEAKKTREDAVRSFTEQYSTLPDIIKTDAEGNVIDDQVGPYMTALENQAKAVTAYQATLQELRKLGLDDATYQKLLKEGPEDQRFADQLLAGGKTAVTALNTLDKNLLTVSTTLATNAATNLYKAGEDAAQGLVNGLKSKQSAVRKAMELLAEEMIRAIKKKLRIKSPSEEFAEIGAFAMSGLAKGFDDEAKNAVSAMQKTMDQLTAALTAEINPEPIITPVLDLSTVRTQAGELAGLTNTVPTVSANQASIISSAQSAAQAEEAIAAAGGTSVTFEQNNYSPEALSDVEIYRQTRNQLSQLKSALAAT